VKTLLLQLVRALTRQPGEVRVHERVEEGQIVLEVSVAEEDRGRLIGRNGRTADALREVLAAVARRRGESCVMEILR
jgi:predicted RNA-binding protein YlqC (UPF0109 family)